MRPMFKTQLEFDFTPSSLKVTDEYFRKYERISEILDANPKIVELIHEDLESVLDERRESDGGRRYTFTTETVLRMLIAKKTENLSYRNAVVRIDDSHCLRAFTRLDGGKMMDYTTLNKMSNAIRPETMEKINILLTRYALEAGEISGDKLRRDTTVCESNIHYPTDSSLLWDVYRVLSRFIINVREIDPEMTGGRRLKISDVKRLYFQINRKASKKSNSQNGLKTAYAKLIAHIDKILDWAEKVCALIRLSRSQYTCEVDVYLHSLVSKYEQYIELGRRVSDQARRRVLDGQSVPNAEKLFSIFEPHVELIKRGKTGTPVEFGHVVNLQQVEKKFIAGYGVYEKKPVEHSLVDPTLERHKKTFGAYPELYADDKGAYESMDKIRELERIIDVVSIGKKGKRTVEETAREHSYLFRLGQKFRAGIEGSISFLKRMLGLDKCMSKGFERFEVNVGVSVFCHNLLVLSRE